MRHCACPQSISMHCCHIQSLICCHLLAKAANGTILDGFDLFFVYFSFLSTINKSVLLSFHLKSIPQIPEVIFSTKWVEKMWTNSIRAWLWHHLLTRRGVWLILLSVQWQLTLRLLPFLLFSYLSYLSYTAPSAAPKNFTFELSEQQLTLSWAALEQEELRGKLLAYKVQWNHAGENQVHHYKESFATLTRLLYFIKT